ncbi:MAG: peptidoglycan-binding protein, partial [Brevundimonas sp.]
MSVQDLQNNLRAKGYDPGAADGQPGPHTYQALAEYMSAGRAPPETGGLIAQYATEGELTTRLRLIHFFAQVSHESGIRPVSENLNYSVEGLKQTFSAGRITRAQCEALGRAPGGPAHQRGIANAVYGGAWGAANLGNTHPGDGWRYRGRGLIQLTGRATYARTGAAYEADPDQVATPAGSVRCAIDYWRTRRLNAAADIDNVALVTRLINGGVLGLAERTALTDRAKAV